jgi:ubiquinone/menaquinone biosynthesis C-methylase UbiE
MNYETLELWMRSTYGSTARKYRDADELDVRGRDHCQICSVLQTLSASFAGQITVLDLGCGTGRFFHCLRNVRKLVGVDVSEEMLAAARHPVQGEEIEAEQIELVCGNFYKLNFAPESFDLIYSVGVFGNGCAITRELLTKLHHWLKPSGRLFFDALDITGLKVLVRARKLAGAMAYSLLPARLQEWWVNRSGWLPLYPVSKRKLLQSLESSGFVNVEVHSRFCQLPMEWGRKLQCIASKPVQIANAERSHGVTPFGR